MLKISITQNPNGDGLLTEVESSGDMNDVVAELGLAVLRMHETVNKSNRLAGAHFRAAITAMFSSAKFWEHAVVGQTLEQSAIISVTPKK